MISIKFRPQLLTEVIGHEKIVNEISDRFRKKNYPQVSYFTGLSGGGKTTLAFNIAKIIQCQHKIDEITPCNKCEHCMDVNKESFMLGTFMFNASNLDIDSMRAIEDLTNTTSFISDKKVIIIDELQELSSNKKAQKNLLKALEKENKEVYFILLSMDDGKVDKAIKNRSVTYKLYPIDYFKIAEYLYKICEQMELTLSEDQTNILFTVAQNSGGSVRQACSYLERVIAGNIWSEEELVSILHITTESQINDYAIMLIDKNPLIFESEISEEIIQRVKTNLIDLAKILTGAKIEAYRHNLLKGLVGYKNASLSKVHSIIETLNELFKFPYVNKEIIDSILIKLFVNEPTKIVSEPQRVTTQVETSQTEEVPKRRRVV